MAVYTEVRADEAGAFVAALGLGPVTALRGIQCGIENTNYFVTTPQGDWVLTLFERLEAAQLPFYLQLMRHLAQRGIPVPEPRADARGELLHRLNGKPAALVNRLPGTHRMAPDLHHCQQVGAVLARMHLAVHDFAWHQPNPRGLAWWVQTAPVVLPHLDAGRAALMSSELGYQQAFAATAAVAALPLGVVHGDLFRDNVVFDGLPGHEKLTGIFDFFFAGVDCLLFDLAVCLNDWCIDVDSGRLDEARAEAMVAAYEAERPLQAAEARTLPALRRAAALRFWLSREWDLHLPREATLLTAHDPGHFERVLRECIATPWHPPR